MESLRAIHFANEFQPNHCALAYVGLAAHSQGHSLHPIQGAALCPLPASMPSVANEGCRELLPGIFPMGWVFSHQLPGAR